MIFISIRLAFTCIYKIFNKLYHPIILNHFTRNNCDFIQPYFKYNYMNNTLITFGPKLWNDLSIDIRKSNSLSLFCKNLKIILYNTFNAFIFSLNFYLIYLTYDNIFL